MSYDGKGLQLPGGPFIEVGHNDENCWSRYSTRQDDGDTVAGSALDFLGKPELMLEAANTLVELAGEMRKQANRALDNRAQLREVTF